MKKNMKTTSRNSLSLSQDSNPVPAIYEAQVLKPHPQFSIFTDNGLSRDCKE